MHDQGRRRPLLWVVNVAAVFSGWPGAPFCGVREPEKPRHMARLWGPTQKNVYLKAMPLPFGGLRVRFAA